MLAAGLLCQGLLADNVNPSSPAAYSPFSLTLELPNKGEGPAFEYIVDVDGTDGTVLFGYLNHGPTFVQPQTTLFQLDLQGLPPGTYDVQAAYMPDLAEGDLLLTETGFSFNVDAAPPTQEIHAFQNDFTEHYFITASDEEAQQLLAQDGWGIVDFGFNVWHADDPAPASALPVCRFYSELVNSHFYTADAAECTMLKEEDENWQYEGIAFQALVPRGGACGAGTSPVWRLYNDRAAQRDSNHRFVASVETYRGMIASGWVGEGVAFCSPPASSL